MGHSDKIIQGGSGQSSGTPIEIPVFWRDKMIAAEQEVPDGYIDAKVYAAMSGCAVNTARIKLHKMEERGEVVSVSVKQGRNYTMHYGPPK